MRESLSSSPNRNNQATAGVYVTIALLALLGIYLFGTIPYDRPPFHVWDLAAYVTMADASPGLAENVSRHFGYRVLGPWVAGLLPLPAPVAFRILTSLVLTATAVSFLWFLRRRGVGLRAATVGVFAFVFNKHAFGYPAWNPFQLGDALAMLALVHLYDAALTGRWRAFAIIFLAGMLSRESVVLALPVGAAVVWSSARTSGRSPGPGLLRLCAAAGPAVVVYAALRLSLSTTGETSFLDAFLAHAPKLSRPETWLRLVVHAQAPLVVLPLVFPRTAWHFLRARPHAVLYLVLVFASTLLGSNNERLMGPAFLVFYWLIAVVLDAHFAHAPRRLALIAGLVVLASADHLYARFPLPGPSVTAVLTSLALAGALVLSMATRRAGVAPGAARGER